MDSNQDEEECEEIAEEELDYEESDSDDIREARLAKNYWCRCNYVREGEVDLRPVEAAWEIPTVSNPVKQLV